MSAILKEKFLDKAYETLSWTEVAMAPVSAISGVSKQDAETLREVFGIDTIRELAVNRYVLLAQGVNAFSRASGVIFDRTVNSKEYKVLRKKPVKVISGISDTDATLLKKALGIDTIQELAENKFVCIAQTILSLAILEEIANQI